VIRRRRPRPRVVHPTSLAGNAVETRRVPHAPGQRAADDRGAHRPEIVTPRVHRAKRCEARPEARCDVTGGWSTRVTRAEREERPEGSAHRPHRPSSCLQQMMSNDFVAFKFMLYFIPRGGARLAWPPPVSQRAHPRTPSSAPARFAPPHPRSPPSAPRSSPARASRQQP
jgi:hypothetical protein